MPVKLVDNPEKENKNGVSRPTKRIRIPDKKRKSKVITTKTREIVSDWKNTENSCNFVSKSEQENTQSIQTRELDRNHIKSSQVVIKATEILDSYIDIRPFFRALKIAIPLAVCIGLVSGITGYFYSKLKTKLYDSTVSFVINEPDEVEGVSTTENRSQHIMSIFERGFILDQKSDNYSDYIVAEMKSRSFTNYFISKLGLKRILFSKAWNSITDSWDSEDKRLSQHQIYTYFSKEVRFINYEEDTGLTYLRIKWQDPVQAAEWANSFIKEFNKYIRDKNLRSIEDTVRRIKTELDKTEILEIKHALSRVLQGKTAISVFTQLKDNVVLSTIDPAIPNWTPVSPKGKLYFVFFFTGSSVVVFTAYMLLVFVKQLKIEWK